MGTNGPVMLMDTTGAVTELPVRGTGPVCWTPDGAPLQLVASSGGPVLRDAHTGRVLQKLSLPGESLVSASASVLAIAADGSRLAAGLGDRLYVWSGTIGALLGQVETRATAFAFSADGSLVATGGADGTTHVYAVPGLTEVAELPPALRGSSILCLAFAQDHVVRYGAKKGTTGALFRSVNKHGAIRDSRLTDQIVADVVKHYAGAVGKHASRFSTHSLRAGFITSAAIAGVPERSIQDQSGHHSVTILRRYIRDACIFRSNAASKVGL